MIHIFAAMVLLGISHLVSFWAMTELKYSRRKTAAIYLGFFVAFVCFVMLTYAAFGDSHGYYAAAFSSTIVMAFFIFILNSADPICKKIFLFISYANVFSMFVCISLIICSVFFKEEPKIVVYYARNIIRTLLFIPVAFIYIRFLRPSVRAVSGKRIKTWYSISVVSVLFLIIFALFVVIFNAEYENLDRYIPFFTVSVLIYISVLWVIFGTIQSMIAESNAELINSKAAYLQGQLKTARENELTSKTIRHDFRHHNQNLESMLKKGEVEEALSYLKQYNDSLDAARLNDFCPNITVNAILNSFFTKAQKNGITVSVAADVKEKTAISDMDFVAVLSNLLENAINGCIECKSDGEIEVNIRTVADKTVIVCSNPCIQDISIENNMIKNRGIGIAGMLSAIRKYGGDIKYSYDSGRLTVCIILNT
mgnify:FL=1